MAKGQNLQRCCRIGRRNLLVRLSLSSLVLWWCSFGLVTLSWLWFGSFGTLLWRLRRWNPLCLWFCILCRTGAWCGCRGCLGNRRSHTGRILRGQSLILVPLLGASQALLCSETICLVLWTLCHWQLQRSEGENLGQTDTSGSAIEEDMLKNYNCSTCSFNFN